MYYAVCVSGERSAVISFNEMRIKNYCKSWLGLMKNRVRILHRTSKLTNILYFKEENTEALLFAIYKLQLRVFSTGTHPEHA
jgi:3-methyladenine DNA glycosylase AlkD